MDAQKLLVLFEKQRFNVNIAKLMVTLKFYSTRNHLVSAHLVRAFFHSADPTENLKKKTNFIEFSIFNLMAFIVSKLSGLHSRQIAMLTISVGAHCTCSHMHYCFAEICCNAIKKER